MKEYIDLDDRVKMCADCGEVVEGRLCTCGCRRTIDVGRNTYIILQALEDRNAPIPMVTLKNHQDAELLRAAGLA